MSAAMTIEHTTSPAPARRRLPPGLVSILRSVLINIVGPSLLYSVVERWFPPDSAGPLLICSLIPIFSLIRGYAQIRLLDAVAVISVIQLGVSIAITLATHDLHRSMALHALQGGAIGLVFAISILVRRPLIRSFARQSMAGSDPEKRATFDARTDTPIGHRIFTVMTLIWAIALIAQSAAMIVAAYKLPADTYIPLHNIVSYALTGGLTWGCIAYGRRRLRK